MRGRYFRYLFENPEGGLFHTGSIFDKEKQKITSFAYIAGGNFRFALQGGSLNSCVQEDGLSGKIDILVLGAYNAEYINRLIGFVKSHEIGTVILPYLAPIQRLVFMETINEDGLTDKETIRFLQDPYGFLTKFGIGRVYFLFGNGAAIDREPEELKNAFCFERINTESFRIIQEMEGYAVPVVQAGYMIENGFLFYFGVYGVDIQVLSEFTKDYFSHMENIHKVSENVNEDYNSQMKRLIQEFLRKFGNSPATSIAMFAGPLHVSPAVNNIFMTQKEFCRNRFCEIWEKCQQEQNCSCVVRCTYGRDHDVLQRYKMRNENPRFGVWILGNVNLNRYLPELRVRFSRLIPRIRGIVVPNMGNGEEWNHQILELFDVKDRIYWMCGKDDVTSAGVVSDIVLSSSNYRFCPLDKEWGCCLSGYVLPKDTSL